ncbi:MAG: hypothetical protein AAFV85_27175 [Cyanobacteria bacterium J06634_6]
MKVTKPISTVRNALLALQQSSKGAIQAGTRGLKGRPPRWPFNRDRDKK